MDVFKTEGGNTQEKPGASYQCQKEDKLKTNETKPTTEAILRQIMIR